MPRSAGYRGMRADRPDRAEAGSEPSSWLWDQWWSIIPSLLLSSVPQQQEAGQHELLGSARCGPTQGQEILGIGRRTRGESRGAEEIHGNSRHDEAGSVSQHHPQTPEAP